jgi:hypothetical protein
METWTAFSFAGISKAAHDAAFVTRVADGRDGGR